MNYLITAAGLGTRFLKKGIKPPKPLIKVKGIELILWSINSFEFFNNDNLYIVCLKVDKVKKILEKKISLIYPNINILWFELDKSLNGQLLTSLRAIDFFGIKGEIIIHNCDTFFKINNKNFNSLRNRDTFGIIPYFNADGNNWSFIKTKEEIIVEVREKERISNKCSVGTYYFNDAEQFSNLASQYINEKKDQSLDEYYIAPFYDYAISKAFNVYHLKCDNVKVYGTCSELLKSFDISINELLSENDFNGHQRKTLVFDIDGTICDEPLNGDYSKCEPFKDTCEKLRYQDSIGTYIILYTSRNMRSFNGNIGLINKYTSFTLNKWLLKNNIPFDELYFGKPWGKDLSYIDDKSLSIQEFLSPTNENL
ncbi:hypothetical protein OA176_01265 [Prochlorococcus sp. AH-716-P13]|nr:hypothetical protein [Prochlorococcus sp. AH-716-P13]